MSSGFDLNFMEDNFFSDDDWASRQINFDLEVENSPEAIEIDSKNLLSNWPAERSLNNPTYLQHENETKPLDFNINELLVGVESPPLTPPEEKIDVDELLKETCNSTAIAPCDDLLSDICITEPSVQPTVSHQLPLVRNRSSSDESSSTSAYSSQSPTPPPKTHVLDVHENLFFSDSLQITQKPVVPDEGFYESVSRYVTTPSTDSVPANIAVLPKSSRFKIKKAHLKRQSSKLIFDEESDFDRRYAEALKETHRLLGTKKVNTVAANTAGLQSPANNSSIKVTKPPLDLRKLCDSTILQSQTIAHTNNTVKKTAKNGSQKSSEKNLTSNEIILKELKRKASEKLKNQVAKQPLTPVTSSFYLGNLAASNCTNLISQTCQIAISDSDQIPLTCTVPSAEPPVKIFVKQETVPKLYLAATSNSNTVTLLPTSNSIKPVSATNPSKEIPLCSLVIKPEQANITVPISSLNLSTGQSPVERLPDPVVTSTSCSKATSPVSNPAACDENKPTGQKSTSKPLMVSQPAKKAIVPNGKVVYPSALLQSCLTVPSPTDANRNQADRVSLNNLDVETQTRVLKRQQRMIKNRQWASQSRQRRKEYLSMLEQQLGMCAEENKKLREANLQLRTRIIELEKENTSLRTLSGTPSSTQRKAACIFVLVLFIGFNINPMSFSRGRISSDSSGLSLNNSKQNWPMPAETGFHGRQLLAVVDNKMKEGKEKKASKQRSDSKKVRFSDKLQSRQEFWLDDMVRSYKKEHISKILEILQVTSPLSLQRLLRRKLKEELGFRVPLPESKARRISYTPVSDENQPKLRTRNMHQQPINLDSSSIKEKIPPLLPKVSKSDHLEEPCARLNKAFDQPNQTDSISLLVGRLTRCLNRISDNLAKWIEQHEVQQTEALHPQESRTEAKRVEKFKRRRRHSYSGNTDYNKSSIPVLYEKRDQKLKRLLRSIDRKNDTVYMISFSKDHILLPASVLDASGHTKMSLVLPTAPPNDSFVGANQAAMIQIDCEVHSTNYLRVDRKLLAGAGYSAGKKNLYVNQQDNQNPKRKAYHGSNQKIINRWRQKSKREQENFPSQDDDATVTEVLDL